MVEERLTAAKLIHDAMVHAVREFKGEPQPWQNGNSTAESYARSVAKEIAALTPTPADDATVERVRKLITDIETMEPELREILLQSDPAVRLRQMLAALQTESRDARVDLARRSMGQGDFKEVLPSKAVCGNHRDRFPCTTCAARVPVECPRYSLDYSRTEGEEE